MDRLNAMSVLLAAVEAGSLSAAGRRLGMPLATVSRKIADLEAHLRTRLLNRSARRLTLTDAGKDYVAACRRILEEVEEAEREAAGEYSAPRGELAVSAPVVFGRLHVLPVVTDFLKTYPEIDVRLQLADGVVDLVAEHVDVAVRLGRLPDSSLVASRVGTIRRIVCASPDYLARRGTPMRPEDLAAHDCIAFLGLTTPELWTFSAGAGQVSVPVHSRLVVTTAEAAIDAAVAGLGLACVLSYQAAAAIRAGTLQPLLCDAEPEPWPVQLVNTGQRQPQKTRAFLDFAAPRLRQALAQL